MELHRRGRSSSASRQNHSHLGFPTAAVGEAKLTEHTECASGNPTLSLLKSAKPCAFLWKGTDNSTWTEFRFLVMFSCVLKQGCQGRKISQEREERQTRDLYDQILKVEKVQTWMQFSPAQLSRQVRAQLGKNSQRVPTPPTLQRNNSNFRTTEEQEAKLQLLHQISKMLGILSLVPIASIKTMTKCNLGKNGLFGLRLQSHSTK